MIDGRFLFGVVLCLIGVATALNVVVVVFPTSHYYDVARNVEPIPIVQTIGGIILILLGLYFIIKKNEK